MKFQNILMTGSRNMGKILQKYPQNGFFPKFFFQKSSLSLLYPYSASVQKSEKTKERSLRYLEKDRLTYQQTKQQTDYQE